MRVSWRSGPFLLSLCALTGASTQVCERLDLAGLRALLARGDAQEVATSEEATKAWRQDVWESALCLDEVIEPHDAVVLHAVMAQHMVDTEEAERARQAWAAVWTLTPGDTGRPLPGWLVPPSGTRPSAPITFEALRVPGDTVLMVDGVLTSQRPVERSALVQGLTPAGEVKWTRWLLVGQDLPGTLYAGETGADPMPEEPRLEVERREEVERAARVVRPREEGEALLEDLQQMLKELRWEEALELAIPAASTWPELEESFRTVGMIAADQIRRSTEEEDDRSAGSRRGYRYRDSDPRSKRFLFGFEAGLPTGVRTEYKFGGRTVDSLGLRVGGNLLFYLFSGVYPVGDGSLYVDFRVADRWDFETSLGVMLYSGSLYPTLGVAAQYDPEVPFQLSIGARLAPFGLMPDVAVGFLW